jgi:hypothetical protein
MMGEAALLVDRCYPWPPVMPGRCDDRDITSSGRAICLTRRSVGGHVNRVKQKVGPVGLVRATQIGKRERRYHAGEGRSANRPWMWSSQHARLVVILMAHVLAPETMCGYGTTNATPVLMQRHVAVARQCRGVVPSISACVGG